MFIARAIDRLRYVSSRDGNAAAAFREARATREGGGNDRGGRDAVVMMHSSRMEENRKEINSSHTAEHARLHAETRARRNASRARRFAPKERRRGENRRVYAFVAKRFMSASNSSRSGFDPGTCVLSDCGCDCRPDEPGVGASKRCHPAGTAAGVAGTPGSSEAVRVGDAEVSRSGPSSWPSRVLGVDPAGSSKEDAVFVRADSTSRKSSSNAETTGSILDGGTFASSA